MNHRIIIAKNVIGKPVKKSNNNNKKSSKPGLNIARSEA